EKTPFTALWGADLLYEAGLPCDLFQVVTGHGSELGPALVESVDFVAFTGSVATGRLVARLAAERLIGCSLELGGKNPMLVLDDGRPRPDLGPWFYEPTILTDLRENMTLFAEETFGPVVALYRFDSVDEAVGRANNSRYGLNASVWTRDACRGRAVASRIQAGSANVNEAYAAAWGSIDAPMGGFKESG